MTAFADYAKTDEFKRDVRAAVDEIVKADLIAPLEARITLLEQACRELLAEARQARGERVDEATDHSGPRRLDVPNPGIV